MTSLSCITILESGSFNTDSGNVVIPAGGVTFPIEALVMGEAAGVGAASGSSISIVLAVGAASGVGAAAGVGESIAMADGAAAGVGSANGIAVADSSLLKEDGDDLLLESGDRILLEA